ncbi:MAG: porin family protein [Bacteroidota bacterium]|nr:porin family protein [Bacteroidota bacterium]
MLFNKKKRLKLLMSLMLCAALSSKAQRNLPSYDYKLLHYGFTVGFSSTNFKLNHDASFFPNDTLASVICKPQAGFNLGVLGDLHLGNHFDIRLIPSLHFAQRNIEFVFRKDSLLSVAKIESTYGELPLIFKYKSDRIKNTRFYVVAGLIYSFDFTSNKTVARKPGDAFVAVGTNNLGYQIGMGFDFYFPYFKFSPEIKLTNGINNVLVRDGSVYSSSISGLFSKILQFNFYIE